MAGDAEAVRVAMTLTLKEMYWIKRVNRGGTIAGDPSIMRKLHDKFLVDDPFIGGLTSLGERVKNVIAEI